MIAVYNAMKNVWELGYRKGARFYIVARYPAEMI
jgi:hypothetical protein